MCEYKCLIVLVVLATLGAIFNYFRRDVVRSRKAAHDTTVLYLRTAIRDCHSRGDDLDADKIAQVVYRHQFDALRWTFDQVVVFGIVFWLPGIAYLFYLL